MTTPTASGHTQDTEEAQKSGPHQPRIPKGLTLEEIERGERQQAEFKEKVRAASLPGETDGFSVYLVAFDDGCRYYGHTSQVIAWRVEELCHQDYLGRVPYLFVHDENMGKTLTCLASGLRNSGAALAERRKIVAQARKDLEWEQNPAAPPQRCLVTGQLQEHHHALMPSPSQIIRAQPPYEPAHKSPR